MVFETDVVARANQTYFGVVIKRTPVWLDRDAFVLNHRLTFGHDRTTFLDVGCRQGFCQDCVELGVGPAKLVPCFT
jgi:hypothetical protein